ncbi:phage baseplate assembly protein V [Halomonas sp. H33-56]|uniref:phage baseplate assembly protein V n=1 Tax=Halomonas sp. H33-56 TaxID=2950873 RepID=UPI0032DFF5B0
MRNGSLARLSRRVMLMLARGVLRQVDDTGRLQLLQGTFLKGETRAGLERMQQYGMTSHPHPGAELVSLFLGGNRDHGLVIAVDDRRYRLTGLTQGEVALYDDQGQKVHLTRDGIVIDGAGKPVSFVNAPVVSMDGDLEVAGQVSDANGSMQEMRDTYNDHDHAGDSGGTTDAPNQSMT